MRYLIDKKRPLIAERPFQMFGGDGGSRSHYTQYIDSYRYFVAHVFIGVPVLCAHNLTDFAFTLKLVSKLFHIDVLVLVFTDE